MGYFSNGTEGDLYEARWCARCVHRDDKPACAVWELHLFRNYDEYDDAESALHVLIPRDGIENQQCRMFRPLGGQPHV